MINNRQAGRRRGRGGQQQRPQGNSGRQDNGNRIDNRARGNAAQLLEKYKTLARDAQMQGDRVNTEYYLQFADHYFRVLAETRSRFEENRRQNGGAAFDEDDQDYDEDGEPIARAEPRQIDARPANGNGQERGQDRGQERSQERGQNGNQGYGQQDRQAGGQQGGQYDDERPRQRNGNGGGNGNGYSEDRQPRDDRGDRGGNSYRGEDRGNRPFYGQDEEAAPVRQEAAPARREAPPRREPATIRREPVAAPEAAPVVAEAASAVEEPRRRGRPRRVVQEEAPAALDADRLPPALSISAVTPDETEEKPRRRRGRPPAAETTAS